MQNIFLYIYNELYDIIYIYGYYPPLFHVLSCYTFPGGRKYQAAFTKPRDIETILSQPGRKPSSDATAPAQPH
jgi:hypothetical protein